MIKIRNAEFEFDFNDADDMERLENSVEKTQKELNELNSEGKKVSQIIRDTCKCIFDCFNDIFGEDASNKIFENKTNFNICIEAFKDLINAREKQEIDFSKEMSAIENKYSPNRATRRAKK